MIRTLPRLSHLFRRPFVFVGAILLVAATVAAVIWWTTAPGPVVEPPLAPEVAIIVSPHPDDETYAMGQTIATQTLAGRRVIAVLITDGESSVLVDSWVQSSGRDVNADGVIDKWDFALVRREEFRAAMDTLGVDELIFMGRADSKGERGFADASVDAAEIEEMLRPIAREHPGATWLTTAKYASDNMRRGDYLDHPDHAATTDAVVAVAEASGGSVYTFKVYVYYLPQRDRNAPLRVRGSPRALAMKREAIGAYSEIGMLSTPELFEASRLDVYEYMVPIPE